MEIIVNEKRGVVSLQNVSKYGLGATLSTALISNAHALTAADITTATTGSDATPLIEAAALFILGIVVVIWSSRKVIGFFSK